MEEQKSTREIASIFNVSANTIKRRVKCMGIMRSNDEATQLAFKLGKVKICSGKASKLWKGGTIRTSSGYIGIYVEPSDFFYSMANSQGYVLEHRLVMAKHLGRCLHPWELVHHKNHIRTDNGLENLQLVSDSRHKQITILENQIARLKEEIKKLKHQLRTKG